MCVAPVGVGGEPGGSCGKKTVTKPTKASKTSTSAPRRPLSRLSVLRLVRTTRKRPTAKVPVRRLKRANRGLSSHLLGAPTSISSLMACEAWL